MTEDKALDLAQEALKLSSVTVDSFGVQRKIQEAITAITAIKQARSAPVQEPAEVLGHNGWGFPIKAAAPVQKKCDCAAHSAADCVCGAWDKSAVAPVQEDWGPGPHEYHNLTAAPVQDIGVEQDERVFARIEARKNRDAAHKETAQRSWVGLTDEEVRETISSVHIEPLFSYRHVARAIEAKLKAKNG